MREFEKKRGALARKPVLTLTPQELKDSYAFACAENNMKRALRCLERIATLETDLNKLKDLRLEIADLYFDSGDLEKAESLYQDFLSLYPGSKAIEYAEYKSILCCFYQTLEADFDQSKTRQALQLSQSFLDKQQFKQYAIDVAAVRKECLSTLFDSEVNVINFYLDKNKLDGAQQRLATLKEQFSNLAEKQPVLVALEYDLAKRQGNNAVLAEKKISLEQIKAQSSPVLAQHTDKKNYAQRF